MTLRLSSLLLALLSPLADGSVWHVLNPQLRELDAQLAEYGRRLDALPSMPEPYPQEEAGFHSGFSRSPDTARWVQVDFGAEYPLDAVVIVPAILGTPEAYGFPLRFRVDASNDPLFGESVTVFDHTGKDATITVAPWSFGMRAVRARYVRFTATRLTTQPRLQGRYIFCLGELLAFSGGRNVALRAAVTAPNAAETLPTWSPRHLVDGRTALGLAVRVDNEPGNGWHSAIETTPDHTKWVQVDLGRQQRLQEVRLIPAHPRDYPDRFGFGFPKRFKVEASNDKDFTSPTMLFDATGQDFLNPGDNAVAFPAAAIEARFVRITATRLWERSGDFVYALAELEVLTSPGNAALGGQVTCLDETITPAWSRERLVDGRSSAGVLEAEGPWLAKLSERREITNARADLKVARDLALAVALRRAAWLGGIILLIFVLWLMLTGLHTRRARRTELEALRQGISRDLHDEIGSHLGSIRLTAEMALGDADANAVHESLQEIHRLAREAAESMRGIIWLVREGGSPALERLVEVLKQISAPLLKGVDHEFVIDAPSAPSATASLEFHRQVLLFFREAVHNIARHANANHVQVRISWAADVFHLEVRDDGQGFDLEASSTGSGLANLRHRASMLKGTMTITSQPGNGTQIALEAPLA
ncbi:MAG: discoidin domain-containing protein [Prosthecobacter sp.]|nr:discoidin domain-containing protein [Prosthecobacter sp.]